MFRSTTTTRCGCGQRSRPEGRASITTRRCGFGRPSRPESWRQTTTACCASVNGQGRRAKSQSQRGAASSVSCHGRRAQPQSQQGTRDPIGAEGGRGQPQSQRVIAASDDPRGWRPGPRRFVSFPPLTDGPLPGRRTRVPGSGIQCQRISMATASPIPELQALAAAVGARSPQELLAHAELLDSWRLDVRRAISDHHLVTVASELASAFGFDCGSLEALGLPVDLLDCFPDWRHGSRVPFRPADTGLTIAPAGAGVALDTIRLQLSPTPGSIPHALRLLRDALRSFDAATRFVVIVEPGADIEALARLVDRFSRRHDPESASSRWRARRSSPRTTRSRRETRRDVRCCSSPARFARASLAPKTRSIQTRPSGLWALPVRRSRLYWEGGNIVHDVASELRRCRHARRERRAAGTRRRRNDAAFCGGARRADRGAGTPRAIDVRSDRPSIGVVGAGLVPRRPRRGASRTIRPRPSSPRARCRRRPRARLRRRCAGEATESGGALPARARHSASRPGGIRRVRLGAPPASSRVRLHARGTWIPRDRRARPPHRSRGWTSSGA